MVRARLWLTCAAAHDPVSPLLLRPALIGWQAKFREVPQTLERSLTGPELLARMKGWVSVDVAALAEIILAQGRLKLLDDRELVVEVEGEADLAGLAEGLARRFGDQVGLERLA